MEELENKDGVSLQTITVNAASPDVIGAVLKKITDSVMEAIPEEAFKKIAEETIKDGSIIYEEKRYYGGSEEVKYNISKNAGKYFSELVDNAVKQSVVEVFKTEEVQDLIHKMVKAGAQEALKLVPKLAVNAFADTITKNITGKTQEDINYLNDSINELNNGFYSLIHELKYNNPDIKTPDNL